MIEYAYIGSLAISLFVIVRLSKRIGKLEERDKSLNHNLDVLRQDHVRYQKMIEKIELNQIRSKERVSEFVESLRDIRERDDINELLNQAFGSLVNRK